MDCTGAVSAGPPAPIAGYRFNRRRCVISRRRLRFLWVWRRRFIGRARLPNLGQVILSRGPVNLPESRKFPTATPQGLHRLGEPDADRGKCSSRAVQSFQPLLSDLGLDRRRCRDTPTQPAVSSLSEHFLVFPTSLFASTPSHAQRRSAWHPRFPFVLLASESPRFRSHNRWQSKGHMHVHE